MTGWIYTSRAVESSKRLTNAIESCEGARVSKTTVLPDNILRRMDPKDRASLGKAGVTAAEAVEKQLNQTEREVHKDIANYLRQHDVWFSHSRMDRKTTQALGVPDFVFCYVSVENMVALVPTAVEVKVGGRKLTSEQESARMLMLSNGWTYHIVANVTQLMEIVKL